MNCPKCSELMPEIDSQMMAGKTTCCGELREGGVCEKRGHRNYACWNCDLSIPKVKVVWLTVEDVERRSKLDSPQDTFVLRAVERGLFASIYKFGILQPIVLDGESFEDGQHRFVVAKILGLPKVPIIEKEKIKKM